MKNKKLSIITIEAIIFIASLIIFILPTILLRNYKYNYIISIALFLVLIELNYYVIQSLTTNSILDITRKLQHYNNNEFGFYISNSPTKELTNLKKELDALANKEESLTKHLKEKIYENESYFKQYKEDIEARKQLVAAISHEIKTPLQVIETTAYAIIDDVIPKEEIKGELENIINETHKTNEMLKEIISIYKTTMNTKEMTKEKINLKDLTLEVLNELSSLTKKYKQKISILNPLDLEIEINYTQFKQALKNILVNAITHSPQKNEVTIELNEHSNYHSLEIINYGINIDKEDINKLFEPFYRSDKARSKKEDNGTGLGLFLVKETLEKHNFDYGLVNVNNGVKFYIIFKK